MPHSRTPQFATLLRAQHLKATPQRLAILRALFRASTPLTASEIQSIVSRYCVNQATVYRTLKELTSVGILRYIDLHHGHAHYELTSPTDHHHITCTRCGVIEDFPICPFPNIQQKTLSATKRFARIDTHSFELFGICTSCARRS